MEQCIMPVIAIANQKGGCGKSTTAVHLAYWLQPQGPTILIDADAQQSSSQWLGGMSEPPPCEVMRSPDDILEKIPVIADQYKYVIVDGPASLSEITRAILFCADIAVVPCQPTGVDLRSASDAVRLIAQAQSVRGGQPIATAFLSRAVKGTKLKDEAITLLQSTNGIRLLRSVVHQKQAIADTSGQGATVWDLGGRAGAESGREYVRL
ncbi:MAG: AAA family ATPase, partial [Microcoleus sp.]